MIYYSPIPNLLIIICNLEQIMEIFFNVETQLNHSGENRMPSYMSHSIGQDHLIEMYLSHEVFYQQELQRISEISEESQQKHDSKTVNIQPQTQETIPIAKNDKKHKKSIFHNFQKHLISTIKKYMNFNKNRFNDLPETAIAFELWQSFMKTGSFNKRLMHIVFGVESDHPNKSNLQQLSSEFGQFQKIYDQFGDQLILKAQKMIRSYVVEQSRHISKAFLRSNSNITKFEEFYGYYSQFIAEIECGPMPKRMKKTSKKTLIDNLKSKKHSK